MSTVVGGNPNQQSAFSLRVGDVRLVVPSSTVINVVGFEPPTRIPRTPQHILGLLPFGEGAIAVVDLAHFLQIEQTAQREESSSRRVVIARSNGLEAGLLCDQTHGVMSMGRIRLEAPTVLKGGRLGEFVTQEFDSQQARVGVLDLPKMLVAASMPSRRGER